MTTEVEDYRAVRYGTVQQQREDGGGDDDASSQQQQIESECSVFGRRRTDGSDIDARVRAVPVVDR